MTLTKGEIEKEKMELPNQMDAILELLKEQKNKIAFLEERLSKGKGNSEINLDEIIAATIKGVRSSEKEINHKTGNIRLEDIDKDDILEKPIIYCVPKSGFVMCDYLKHGHPIAPPYGIGMVFFEHFKTSQKGNGKEANIYHTSSYKCESKKIQQWIEDSPHYKLDFIFKIEKPLDSLSIRKAVRGATMMSLVANFGAIKVLQMCTQFNVPKHEDLDIMRNHLISAMVEKEFSEDKKASQQIASDTAKENLFIHNGGTDSVGAKK